MHITDEAGMGALAALEKLEMQDEVTIVSVGGIQDVKQAMAHTRNYLCLDVSPYVGELLVKIVKERSLKEPEIHLTLQEYDYRNYEEMVSY